ncbi:hypothetical protein BH18ACT15_BH18ACT15_08080 [soil metagenome]
MGQKEQETVTRIERTRDELAGKVDVLIDRSKVEAGEIGKKVAVAAAALTALIVVGTIAKRRVTG